MNKKNLFFVVVCIFVALTSCASFQKKESKRLSKLERTLIKAQEGDENTESYTFSYDARGVYCDNYSEGWSQQILSNDLRYQVLESVVNLSDEVVETLAPKYNNVVIFNDFKDWDVIVYDSHNIFVADNRAYINKGVLDDKYLTYLRAYYVLMEPNKPIKLIQVLDLVVDKDFNEKVGGSIVARFYGTLIALYADNNVTSPLQKLKNRIGEGILNEWSYCFEDYDSPYLIHDDPYSFYIRMKFSPYRPGRGNRIPIHPYTNIYFKSEESQSQYIFKDIIENTISDETLLNMKSTLDNEFRRYLQKHSISYDDILRDYDKNYLKAATKYEGESFFIILPVKKFSYSTSKNGQLLVDVDVNRFSYDYLDDIYLYSNDESFAELNYPCRVCVWAKIKGVKETSSLFSSGRKLEIVDAILLLFWDNR